jgi:hypothetical protein
VTDKITVAYGGEQRLDHETNTVMLDVSFRNSSSATISGPLFLQVDNVTSDLGNLELLNPSTLAPSGTKYIDLSPALPQGSLAPGQTTSPYQLRFHLKAAKFLGQNHTFILEIKLRLLQHGTDVSCAPTPYRKVVSLHAGSFSLQAIDSVCAK